MKTAIASPPQSGAVTHHHDQLITPHNFKTRKTINVSPANPMPLDELF